MEEKNTQDSSSVLLAAAVALTFFWKLNIFKESFAGVKNALNFYPPVGPLLGLFLSSIFVYVLALILLKFVKVSPKIAFILFAISTILFALMVFPPIFIPIAELLKD